VGYRVLNDQTPLTALLLGDIGGDAADGVGDPVRAREREDEGDQRAFIPRALRAGDHLLELDRRPGGDDLKVAGPVGRGLVGREEVVIRRLSGPIQRHPMQSLEPPVDQQVSAPGVLDMDGRPRGVQNGS
jgi:hypothetical protein